MNLTISLSGHLESFRRRDQSEWGGRMAYDGSSMKGREKVEEKKLVFKPVLSFHL